MNDTVSGSLCKEVKLLLLKKKQRVFMDFTRLREITKKGPEKWSAGFSLETRQTRISNLRIAELAMATRTRDNIHKQTTFIISFSFFFNM